MLNKVLKSLVLLAIIQCTSVNSMNLSSEGQISSERQIGNNAKLLTLSNFQINNANNVTLNNTKEQNIICNNADNNGNTEISYTNKNSTNNINNIDDILEYLKNLYKKSKSLNKEKRKYQSTTTLLSIFKNSENSENLKRNFSTLGFEYQTLIANYLVKSNKNINSKITECFKIFETYDNIESNKKEIISNGNKYSKNIKKINSKIFSLKEDIKNCSSCIIQDTEDYLKAELENIGEKLSKQEKKLEEYEETKDDIKSKLREIKRKWRMIEQEIQEENPNLVIRKSDSFSFDSQNWANGDYPEEEEEVESESTLQDNLSEIKEKIRDKNKIIKKLRRKELKIFEMKAALDEIFQK